MSGWCNVRKWIKRLLPSKCPDLGTIMSHLPYCYYFLTRFSSSLLPFSVPSHHSGSVRICKADHRSSASWLAPRLCILLLSFFLILLQSFWPTLLLSEHARTLLLQDFCISCFLCLKCSSPRYPQWLILLLFFLTIIQMPVFYMTSHTAVMG